MNVQFLVDQDGKKTGVFLSLDEFEHLLNLVEEVQEIQEYRAAKADKDEWVSLTEAKKQLGL
mgnify:CR=1 FL=1